MRPRTDFPCRSVYLPVIRNDLPELFQVFNFADPHATTGAPQALFMMNDQFVMDAADVQARWIMADGTLHAPNTRIERMIELILNSPPTDAERVRFLAFVENS